MSPRAILALAAASLVVGVIALIVGLSAKNGNTIDKELSTAVKNAHETVDHDDYTSENTERMDVAQTKALILALPEVRLLVDGAIR